MREQEISGAINSLAKRLDDELFASSRTELEGIWCFRWNVDESAEWNLYDFHTMLGLYGHQCRRWEEHHNGSCCVVERVRDMYLRPKIREFLKCLQNAADHGDGRSLP